MLLNALVSLNVLDKRDGTLFNTCPSMNGLRRRASVASRHGALEA